MQFLKRLKPFTLPQQNPNANTIYVDSDDNTIKVGTGASGSTERTIFDSINGGSSSGNLTGAHLISLGDVQISSTGALYWLGSSVVKAPSDGVITLLNTAQTGFTRLQFGGTTSSFGALATSGTQVRAVLGDASDFTAFLAKTLSAESHYILGVVPFMVNSTPSIASGFGTSPSVVAANGTAAFTINVGTGGVATSGVVTMPTATTGWIASVENQTGVLGNVADRRTVQIASTTTSITLENQVVSTGAAAAWAASDVLVVTAMAY